MKTRNGLVAGFATCALVAFCPITFVTTAEAETKSWTEVASLSAPIAEPGDNFGASLAASGDVIVSISPDEDDLMEDSGAIYVHELNRASGQWEQTARLVLPDQELNSGSGLNAAILGDSIVVGAPELGTFEGGVFLFERQSDGAWALTSELPSPDGQPFDEFGVSVAISESWLVVGASVTSPNGSHFNGSVYIAPRDPGTEEWQTVFTVLPDDVTGYKRFGEAVAVYGNTLVVGAPGDDEAVSGEAGAVYVFDYLPEKEEWHQVAKLLSPIPQLSAEFGDVVAIDERTLWGSAPSHDIDGKFSAGTVFSFVLDETTETWIRSQQLLASVPMLHARYGSDLAFDGELLAVGAPVEGDVLVAEGTVHLYEFSEETELWELSAQLYAGRAKFDDRLGTSVAFAGDAVAAGAFFGSGIVDRAGSTQIFTPVTVDPHVEFVGTCPGNGVFTVSGLTPRGRARIFRAAALGVAVPLERCSETVVDLEAPVEVAITAADDDGVASRAVEISGYCGEYMQVVDMTTCATTGVEQVPPDLD